MQIWSRLRCYWITNYTGSKKIRIIFLKRCKHFGKQDTKHSKTLRNTWASKYKKKLFLLCNTPFWKSSGFFWQCLYFALIHEDSITPPIKDTWITAHKWWGMRLRPFQSRDCSLKIEIGPKDISKKNCNFWSNQGNIQGI